MSIIPGYKFENIGKPIEGLKCKDATFVKYGKEISIHDFIQEGRDGTIATEIVQKAGGLKQLAHANENLPTSDIVIDLNMDAYQANKIIKCGNIAQKKLDEMKKLQEKLESIKEKKPTIEKKGENVNE